MQGLVYHAGGRLGQIRSVTHRLGLHPHVSLFDVDSFQDGEGEVLPDQLFAGVPRSPPRRRRPPTSAPNSATRSTRPRADPPAFIKSSTITTFIPGERARRESDIVSIRFAEPET